MDADGDEIMSGGGRDELGGGEDGGLILSEDTLKQVELRKGESPILDVLKHRFAYASLDMRFQKFAKRFCPGG